jgi:hypothetical protein
MKTILSILFFSLTVSQAAGQQAHSSLSDQKMCAAQAKKFFMETDFSNDSKHPLKNEFTSHYDAPKKICYVRINYTIRTPETTEIAVSNYVFDAFEGRGLASYIWISEKGKKFWEVKPMECWVKPVGGSKANCASSEGFEAAVEKHFGLGE